MSKINLLKALKSAMDTFKAEIVTKENKFIDGKLVDGTLVRVADAEAFKVGDKLTYILEDGSVVDAKEGMHELEDGTVIVVDAESKITEITAPEVDETDEVAPTEMSAKKKVIFKDFKREVYTYY